MPSLELWPASLLPHQLKLLVFRTEACLPGLGFARLSILECGRPSVGDVCPFSSGSFAPMILFNFQERAVL